ncbi:non-specific serine/threonine protein kinase [Malassezia caprae]|uniref:non-specific serine/threonine protein kinase n=1 Tax=Malassezia caprae TaxID=1381934 RepID=A0AAF0IZ00_9BASI|nr:non-specific serine/threonine protein kinase [Malassezia caprae]
MRSAPADMSRRPSSHVAHALEGYEALDVIGSGTFGLIRKVRRKSDGRLFARKELNFERMNERDRKHIVSEVNILRTLQHDHVVRYEERYVDTENGILYIVMELCEGGDLGSVIKRCRKSKTHLPEETVWGFFAQMVSALEACHYRSAPGSAPGVRPTVQAILHRDLKPENVFLDADQNVKLGDFGLSKQIASQAFANTYVGTPYYMSPELATGQPYDTKSDVWALGCIVYELCALSPPFDASNQAELTHKIKQGLVPALPRQYSRDLQEAVHIMLQLDHRRRPTARQLLQIKQIKLACRTHALAQLHKAVLQEKERVQQQALALDAREAALAERERACDTAQATASATHADARALALEEREMALHERERELCRREEACASYSQELMQWTQERSHLQEELASQRRALQEKDALLARLQTDTSSLARSTSRARPRRSSPLKPVIEAPAVPEASPVAARAAALDEEWVDDDVPPPFPPSKSVHAAASALTRLRRAEADVSDCSMRDASCMWRSPRRFHAPAVSSPLRTKRTSLPGDAAPSLATLPASRTEPMNLNKLPREPQWHLCSEEERPSPFLKRVTRIPLESLQDDGLGDAGIPDTVSLVPGPAKPKEGSVRGIESGPGQENVAARALDARRRRSSLLRPPETRSAQQRPLASTRMRAPGIPPSPSTRSVRPMPPLQRVR